MKEEELRRGDYVRLKRGRGTEDEGWFIAALPREGSKLFDLQHRLGGATCAKREDFTVNEYDEPCPHLHTTAEMSMMGIILREVCVDCGVQLVPVKEKGR